jgi:hypothetical protein
MLDENRTTAHSIMLPKSTSLYVASSGIDAFYEKLKNTMSRMRYETHRNTRSK